MEACDALLFPLPYHISSHRVSSVAIKVRWCDEASRTYIRSTTFVPTNMDLMIPLFPGIFHQFFRFTYRTLWETRVEDPDADQNLTLSLLLSVLCCVSTVTNPIRLTSWLFQLPPRLFSALAEFIAQSPSRSRGGLWYQTLITICCVFEAFLRIDSSALNSLKIIRGDLILEHRWSTKDLNHWLEDEDAQQSVSSIYSEFSVCPSSISFDILRNTEKCYSILDQESKLA